jgi:hypothetical protein
MDLKKTLHVQVLDHRAYKAYMDAPTDPCYKNPIRKNEGG